MTTEEMYEKFGIKKDVIDFGKTVLGEIEDRFAKIDEVAEINQLKVIHAMQKNRVSENHLWGTTGYGYNDTGRDTLEAVYADIFEAEDALVRSQITCGTHALTILYRRFFDRGMNCCRRLENHMIHWKESSASREQIPKDLFVNLGYLIDR